MRKKQESPLVAFFFILLALLLLANRSSAGDIQTFNHYYKLIPRPQKIEIFGGEGISYSAIQNICLKNTDHIPVLSGVLESLPSNRLQKRGTLTLKINKDLELPSSEGYILEVRNGQVFIQAKEQSGLFYGIQTLNQLLEDSHDQSVAIPPCKITDYPKIACRAVHLDLKYHLDAVNYYYSIIDRLAKIKVNTIIVEFEDKLRYRKAKEVGAPDAISIEEFVEISKYAEERNIEISPLVQGLGHASFILKHEAYKNLRDDSVSDYAFDPLNPKTYELQFSLYEDAMAATPFGKYLHVGGDEVGALGKSILSKSSGMKPLELQMYWLKKVTDFATAHNRIPVFWDDMVFKLAGLYETTYDPEISDQIVKERWNKNEAILGENISLFPRNCTYARWNYESPQVLGNKLAIDWYNAHHLNVMAVTAAQESSLMMPRNNSNFKSIGEFCQLAAEKNIDKVLCTIWDDSSPHFETVWRGLHDFAGFSWNDKSCSEQLAHSAFRHRFYSPDLEADSFEFQNPLEDALAFWETAFLSEGDRENYQPSFKLVELPDISKTGEWSFTHKDKLNGAKNAVSCYRQIKRRIDKSLLLTRRNRYAIEVMNQINEVQVYSARLLLLLQQYDISRTKKDKQNSVLLIKKCVEEFPELREKFEKVLSRTRILKNPDGYKYDSNIRAHWADVGNNTDWIYFYELAMNKKIAEWLKNLDVLPNQ